MLKQKTLKDSFSLRGKGLHTGLDLTVTFNPAPENHGRTSGHRCCGRQRDRDDTWYCVSQKWSKSKHR